MSDANLLMILLSALRALVNTSVNIGNKISQIYISLCLKGEVEPNMCVYLNNNSHVHGTYEVPRTLPILTHLSLQQAYEVGTIITPTL